MGKNYCGAKFVNITLTWLVLLISVTNAAICRRMVIFGDSISDNGVDADNDPHGFKQFSNGPTWPDYLTRKLGLKYGSYWNMAYSGAFSGLGNYYGFNWSGVKWQAQQFIREQTKNVIPFWLGWFFRSSMVVIQAGGINDIYAKNINPEDSAKNLKDSLKSLIDTGVNEFVVLNVIDISKCPGEVDKADTQKSLRDQSAQINRLLPDAINTIQRECQRVNIIQVDVQNIMNDLIQLGKFVNQKLTYTSNNTLPGEVQRYLWFDDYHPSSFAQKEIADKVYKVIQNTKCCSLMN